MRKVVICSIIKNEHRYLEEWIKHNLSIGVDKIFLYEDEGSESHSEITDKYENVVIDSIDVIKEKKVRTNKQITLYNWFLNKYKGIFDYMIAIDPDEYINFEGFSNIHDFGDSFGDFQAIALYYKWMSANNHVERPNGNIVDNYTEDVDHSELWQFKTIVNLNSTIGEKVRFINSHCVKGITTINTKGEEISTKRNNKEYENSKTFVKAYIKHYVSKSWEDWVERLVRGNITRNYRNADTFFTFNPDMKKKQSELVDSLNEMEFPTIDVISLFGTLRNTSVQKYLDEMNAPLPEGVSPYPEMNMILNIHVEEKLIKNQQNTSENE